MDIEWKTMIIKISIYNIKKFFSLEELPRRDIHNDPGCKKKIAERKSQGVNRMYNKYSTQKRNSFDGEKTFFFETFSNLSLTDNKIRTRKKIRIHAQRYIKSNSKKRIQTSITGNEKIERKQEDARTRGRKKEIEKEKTELKKNALLLQHFLKTSRAQKNNPQSRIIIGKHIR